MGSEVDMSAPAVVGCAIFGASSAEFGVILGLIEEGLVDQFISHRCRDFGLSEMLDDATGQLDRDCRCCGDLQCHLHRGVIEFLTSHDARHDAKSECFLRVERTSSEHHVAYDAVAAHLKETTYAASVGNDPVASFGEHELCIFSSDANIAKKCTLERTADGPTLDRHDDRCVKIEQLLDALVAAGHQFVVGEAGGVVADGTNIST